VPIIYAQYLYWYWYLKVRYWYLYWYLEHWYWYWYWYLFVEYLIQDWRQLKKRRQVFLRKKVDPNDMAGGFSDLEMTWLLYCAVAATGFNAALELPYK